MSTTQRVVFSFDENSLSALNTVKKRGGFTSLGSAVRESIQLNEFLQDQAAKGFSEIVLRDPESQKEKTIMIPSLQKLAKDKDPVAK
jgi:hypothetical protein